MKNTLIFLVALTLSLNNAVAQNWDKYKSEDLAFVAYFPDAPKRTVQQVDTAVGKLDMHMVMLTPTNNDDNAVYSVIRSDYPKAQFEDVDETMNKNVLDGAVNGAVSNVNGKLLADETINFNGYPGRDIKIEIQGGYIYIRAYLVQNVMFISQVICLTEKDKNPSIERFLNSFELIKVKS